MTGIKEIPSPCRNCGTPTTVKAYSSINVGADPSLRDKVKSGELFTWQCPHCGKYNLVKYPTTYIDPAAHLIICLSDNDIPIKAEGLEAYSCRVVGDVGSLIEKVKIFDDGLDDVVMELCKYVSMMEMKKDADLRYLRLDGADGDITLAYPQDGEMQMVAVGFNVYEDCRGIVMRNPEMKERAAGFARIDRDWVASFFK